VGLKKHLLNIKAAWMNESDFGGVPEWEYQAKEYPFILSFRRDTACFHQKNLEDCFNLTGLKKIKENSNKEYNKRLLRRSEQAHILVLKSKSPTGLNLR